MKKGVPKKYKKLSVLEFLESDKERLKTLASYLKRYTKRIEVKNKPDILH